MLPKSGNRALNNFAGPVYDEGRAPFREISQAAPNPVEITAMAPKTARARLTSFATAKRKLRFLTCCSHGLEFLEFWVSESC